MYPAGPLIIEIYGFDAVITLSHADIATISANAVGLPPTASARLIASGTITMVAPTWLLTSENSVVSSAIASWLSHTGRPSGRPSMLCPATHARAPLASIAQHSGIRQDIRQTDFHLLRDAASSLFST